MSNTLLLRNVICLYTTQIFYNLVNRKDKSDDCHITKWLDKLHYLGQNILEYTHDFAQA